MPTHASSAGKKGAFARVALLYGVVSGKTRGLASLAGGLSLASKLAFVGAAVLVAHADATTATAVAIGVGLLMATQRIVLASARVEAECDLYRAGARALLAGDVLAVPAANPGRVVFESGHLARGLLIDTVPELAANVVACVAVAPILVSELHPRMLVLAAIGLVVVLVSFAVIHRIAPGWQKRLFEAHQRVTDRVTGVVEGRVELVASASEASALRALDGELAAFSGAMRRASIASALRGRAPIAAGVAVVVVVALVDPETRQTVGTALLANALLLAAAIPILVGLVLGGNELLRASKEVAPLLDLLAAPARDDVTRPGKETPQLPATLALRDVSFGYKEARAVLAHVSLDWKADEPLVLEGPNGAGKSTVLRLMIGLRLPDEGRVMVGERELAAVDAALFRANIAYLPQRPYLGEAHATVRDAFHFSNAGLDDAAMWRALERLELAPALRARGQDGLAVAIGELSAGQRQRLALARTLCRDARIFMLDEPDANLDVAGVALVAELVKALVRDGKMVAVAAHTKELAALSTARVALGTSAAGDARTSGVDHAAD